MDVTDGGILTHHPGPPLLAIYILETIERDNLIDLAQNLLILNIFPVIVIAMCQIAFLPIS